MGGFGVHGQSGVATYLFTDIEGSTRLWEQEPERMRSALARHDILTRGAVEQNRGRIVKATGDGFHAVFNDPLDALAATMQLQLSLIDPEATAGVPLRVRCGLHAGVDERRDNDFFGPVVNRAARIMSAAHGGQILLSQAVAALAGERLPEGVSLRSLGAVRLRDLTNSEPVYQVMHPQLRQEFPALRSLEGTPNNLPQQVTTFVGRKREQTEVKAAIKKARLLTLSGIGGLGKTRLSLQIAADIVSDYPDGVWFVEFAPIADERLVAQAVATVLGAKEDNGRPVMEALIKHVRDRNLLLVLDNCEHLVRACAELATQLLQAGAGVTILASSREHFNIAGETVYTVPPLSLPEADRRISAETVVQCEAVHLFIERAMAVQPAFKLTEQNTPAVVEICQRLDGIPLALELAAARARSLSVEEIAKRVNDRFRLLTTGDRTALPRQQTLRALIDWSHDLLPEKERLLFRRLGVFAGGWSLDGADEILSDDKIDRADVVNVLSSLVEKSLVMPDTNTGRYRLLETLRQYAREKLEASGEAVTLGTRHLNFYLVLAEKARPKLVGPDQATWLNRLDVESDNIVAAHDCCEHLPDGGESGLRLVSAMKRYWLNRGLLGLGHRLTVEALAKPSAQSKSPFRSRALFDAGQLASFMARYDEAQKNLEESLAIARETSDYDRIAAVLQPLGMAHHGQGRPDRARVCFEEAYALAQRLGNKREIAVALTALAQLDRAEGALDTAQARYEAVLTLTRDLGDRESIAFALLNLAIISIARDADLARKYLQDAIMLALETGSKRAGKSAIDIAAGLSASLGEWRLAARWYGAAEEQAKITGLQRDPSDSGFLDPLIDRGRAVIGAPQFDEAAAEGSRVPYAEALAEIRSWLQSASSN